MQTPPIKNDRLAVWDSVIEDIQGRDRKGIETYGTRLQPFNGRCAVQDAYEEALDLSVYLKQKLLEEKELQVKTYMAAMLALVFGKNLGVLSAKQEQELVDLTDQMFLQMDEETTTLVEQRFRDEVYPHVKK
jgi:hypothetical protein